MTHETVFPGWWELWRMRLHDLTIVVTGASSGLGRAMASAFVEEGANVVCASRSREGLTAAVSGLRAYRRNGEMTKL